MVMPLAVEPARETVIEFPPAKSQHRRLMPCLSVVERELRVAGRRRATYRIRFWAVLALLAIFAWNLYAWQNRVGSTTEQGRQIFTILGLWAFFYAASIGVIVTADSVSEEKREGTLGLLFLTDLKGHDVIHGKLVANSVNVVYGLVAILPILGIPLLLGGVTLVQFLKLILALLSTMALSLSTGILVSTYSRQERKAMFFSVLGMLALICVPFLFTFWVSEGMQWVSNRNVWRGLLFSPGFAVGMVVSESMPTGWPPVSYWYSVVWTCLLCVVFLARASAKIPHSWDESEPAPKLVSLMLSEITAVRPRPAGPPRRLLEQNPFLWLALRGEASPRRVLWFVTSVLFIWFLGWLAYGRFMLDEDVRIPSMLTLHGFLKIWIAGEASRRFVEDRRNNSLEFLLSTPLTERQIIRGQWQALARQFRVPIAILLAWETVLAFGPFPRVQRHDHLGMMFFLVVDSVALSWLGMWLGMNSKGRGRAILVALGLVLLLPWVLARVSFSLAGLDQTAWGGWPTTPARMEMRNAISILISLTVDLAVIFWARARLQKQFRTLATETHHSPGD